MMVSDMLELYKVTGCSDAALPGLQANPQCYGRRAKVDRIALYCEKHIDSCDTADELLDRVRQEWTAGLGPIASTLMWWAIRSLVKQVVLWIWKRYSS
jgi:hypothetical protein